VAYRVFIDNAAEKDIDRLPKNTRKLVLEEIKELAKDPRKPRAEPLEGKLKFEIAICDLKTMALRSTNQSVRFHRRGCGDALLRLEQRPCRSGQYHHHAGVRSGIPLLTRKT